MVAVEAARGRELARAWWDGGDSIHGIDRFGASAPGKQLAEFFGYTPDRLGGASSRVVALAVVSQEERP